MRSKKRNDNVKSIFTDIQIRAVNKVRRDFGLPLVSFKERHCLRCEALFDSYGAGNRLCDQCNRYLPTQMDFGVKVNAKN